MSNLCSRNKYDVIYLTLLSSFSASIFYNITKNVIFNKKISDIGYYDYFNPGLIMGGIIGFTFIKDGLPFICHKR